MALAHTDPPSSPLSAFVPSLAAQVVPCLLLDESARLAVALGQRDLKELRQRVIVCKEKEREEYDEACLDLIAFCSCRDIENVREIIKSRIYNLDRTDSNGQTAVMWACENVDKHMLHLLSTCPGVSKHINCGEPQTGRTALHYCVAFDRDHELDYDQAVMLKLLLSIDGIDVNKEDLDGLTPLDYACDELGEHDVCCRVLRENGAVHGRSRRFEAQQNPAQPMPTLGELFRHMLPDLTEEQHQAMEARMTAARTECYWVPCEPRNAAAAQSDADNDTDSD